MKWNGNRLSLVLAFSMLIAWAIPLALSLSNAQTAPPSSRPSDGTQQLTILHSNDVHGHLRPFSYPSGPTFGRASMTSGSMQGAQTVAMFDLPARQNIGGIARRATMARQIRKEQAGQGTPVWLIDAGDFFHYSPFSYEYHGDADVLSMNAAGYDLAGFGNHEFGVSTEQFLKFVKDARFDFLCANVTDAKTHEPIVKPFVIRQVGPVRVGIFGLVTNVGRSQAAKGVWDCADYAKEAPGMVTKLRGEEKADIVVLISHIGESSDRKLARDVPGINVIVGAHSHHRLPDGEFVPWSDQMKPDEVNGTVIVQAGQWGGELGRLDLMMKKNIEGNWRVCRYHASMIPITSDIPEDAEVNATLDKLWAPHAAKYDEVLATATADFAERGDDITQSYLYADAVRAAMGTELEFDRTGSAFWPIIKGKVTRASLVDLEQSKSTVVTFRMKGSEIRKLVEKTTPIVSGLRYRMATGKLVQISLDNGPLDDTHEYTCAANSATVGRLEGLEMLDRKDTETPWADAVRKGIRKMGTISPSYDSRRIAVSAPRSSSRASKDQLAP